MVILHRGGGKSQNIEYNHNLGKEVNTSIHFNTYVYMCINKYMHRYIYVCIYHIIYIINDPKKTLEA